MNHYDRMFIVGLSLAIMGTTVLTFVLWGSGISELQFKGCSDFWLNKDFLDRCSFLGRFAVVFNAMGWALMIYGYMMGLKRYELQRVERH